MKLEIIFLCDPIHLICHDVPHRKIKFIFPPLLLVLNQNETDLASSDVF